MNSRSVIVMAMTIKTLLKRKSFLPVESVQAKACRLCHRDNSSRRDDCPENGNCGDDLIVHNLAADLDDSPAYFQPWGCARDPEGARTAVRTTSPKLRAKSG